jgi:hypothetical protein
MKTTSVENPPWLHSEDVQPLNNSPASSVQGSTTHNEVVSKSPLVYWCLKITTMTLCTLMAATAIIGIGKLCVF